MERLLEQTAFIVSLESYVSIPDPNRARFTRTCIPIIQKEPFAFFLKVCILHSVEIWFVPGVHGTGLFPHHGIRYFNSARVHTSAVVPCHPPLFFPPHARPRRPDLRSSSKKEKHRASNVCDNGSAAPLRRLRRPPAWEHISTTRISVTLWEMEWPTEPALGARG